MKLANIAGSGAGVGLVLPPLYSQPLPGCVLYQLLELVSGFSGRFWGLSGNLQGRFSSRFWDRFQGRLWSFRCSATLLGSCNTATVVCLSNSLWESYCNIFASPILIWLALNISTNRITHSSTNMAKFPYLNINL
jgi:hypothetical protein